MTQDRPGPIPAWIGRLLAPAYGLAVSIRNRKYEEPDASERLPIPVISVGNLSVGGTGKTPTVVSLARELILCGLRPCIAMRGYSKGGDSDEAMLYRSIFEDIPVVAQPDRASGIRELMTRETIDCVILDDGFQHRQVARDVDIVLADASRNLFRDRLLPLGWLREPVSSLKRADHVVVTHAELIGQQDLEDLHDQIAETMGRGPIAVTRHTWVALDVRDADGTELVTDVGWLRDRAVVPVCAIGHPEGFIDGVVRSGARIEAKLVLPDHDPYRPQTIDRIRAIAKDAPVVTTAKDWTKLRGKLEGVTVARPQLRMAFDSGQEALASAVIQAVRRPKVAG